VTGVLLPIQEAEVTDQAIDASAGYEAPALAEVGTLHELTLGCDKAWGDSDGFTFAGVPITCASS
jgi:hypothetical protein